MLDYNMMCCCRAFGPNGMQLMEYLEQRLFFSESPVSHAIEVASSVSHPRDLEVCAVQGISVTVDVSSTANV
jgi:hypothetical protein